MDYGPQPNYYNNNYMQNNPYDRPQQPYQPEPIYLPPPAPIIQPYPMNAQTSPYIIPRNPTNPVTTNPTTVYHIVNNPGYPPCPFCNRAVARIPRRVIGQAQLFWCFILFLCLPLFCWIPFCMQSCHDLQYECSDCMRVVNVTIRPIC